MTLSTTGDLIVTTNDNGYIRIVERFQVPRMTVLSRDRVHLQLTAGRPHHVETTADLRTWSRWQTLDAVTPEKILSEWPREHPYLRVTW